MVDFTRDEIAHLLRPTADLNAALGAISRGEWRAVGVAQQVAGIELRDRALARHLLPGQTLPEGAGRILALRVVLPRISRHVLAVAILLEHVPLRSPGLRALRRYADDAISGLRPVQGGRRWPLHDLDALDFVGIDVVEKRRMPAADVHRAVERRRARFDFDPVHVDEGVVRERRAAQSANSHARARADRAVLLDEGDAGHATVQQILHVRDRRRIDDPGGVHLGDGVSELAGALLTGRRRHELFQHEGHVIDEEIRGRHIARYDREGSHRGAVADAAGTQLVRARGHSADHIDAGIVRERTETGAGHDNRSGPASCTCFGKTIAAIVRDAEAVRKGGRSSLPTPFSHRLLDANRLSATELSLLPYRL